MGYFVIERGRDDSLRLVFQGVFPSREAARDALGVAMADGSVSLLGDAYVVDLDAAVPVLFIVLSAPAAAPATPETPVVLEEQLTVPEGPPTPATAQEEPPIAQEDAPAFPEQPESEDLAPADVQPELADEAPAAEYATAAEVPAAAEPPVAEAAVEPFLTAGVPLPPVEWAVPARTPDDDPAASLADALRRATLILEEEGIVAPASIESGIPPAPVTDLGAVLPTIQSEPVAAVDPAWPGSSAETFGASASMGALEEPAVEVAPIIKSAPPEGEDAYLPRPVILGDYSDVALGTPDEPTAVNDATTPSEDGLDFAVSSDLQLETYTCDDCVYANTCPKVGTIAPAECGAFQWRSE